MKKVFIIHGWDGSPQSAWFPWFQRKLEGRGFSVTVPAMPHPENPTIDDWVNYLTEVVGEPDKNTYFVGHSIGCQTIMRYIEKIQKPIGGMVFVAGWIKLLYLQTDEEKQIAKPWQEIAIDYEKIKRLSGKIIAIFSDDDPDVDLINKELFEKYLGAKTILEHNKGHFSDDAGVKELPSALEAVLEITS